MRMQFWDILREYIVANGLVSLRKINRNLFDSPQKRFISIRTNKSFSSTNRFWEKKYKVSFWVIFNVIKITVNWKGIIPEKKYCQSYTFQLQWNILVHVLCSESHDTVSSLWQGNIGNYIKFQLDNASGSVRRNS